MPDDFRRCFPEFGGVHARHGAARARNGRSIEVVGTYNPRTAPASLELKRDRIDYWVSNGAQMSERVSKLFAKAAPEPAVAA